MRDPSRLLVVLPLVVVTALAASCVQVLGIKELPRTCGAVSYASTDCATCMSEACCAEVEACVADTRCATKLACSSACAVDDTSCRIACGDPVDRPATPEADVASCRGRACASSCVSCAGYADKFGAACATCVRSASLAGSSRTCCGLEEACAARPSCDATARCLLRCSNPACVDACFGAASPDDQVRINEIVRCTYLCDACGFGSDFACVRDYELPVPNQPKAKVRAVVTDRDGRAIAGADVRACTITDFGCSPESALARARASSEGIATLEIPLNATNGFQGFLVATDPAGTLLPAVVNADGLVFDGTMNLRLYSSAFVQNGAKLVGETFDPSVDVLLVLTAWDCRYAPAAGVDFVVEAPFASTRVYYLDSAAGVPDPKAVATPASGLAFALVHPPKGSVPGYLSLEGRRAGEVVGRSVVPLRAGTVTSSGYRLLPASGG